MSLVILIPSAAPLELKTLWFSNQFHNSHYSFPLSSPNTQLFVRKVVVILIRVVVTTSTYCIYPGPIPPPLHALCVPTSNIISSHRRQVVVSSSLKEKIEVIESEGARTHAQNQDCLTSDLAICFFKL